jgi:hypothetical protein
MGAGCGSSNIATNSPGSTVINSTQIPTTVMTTVQTTLQVKPSDNGVEDNGSDESEAMTGTSALTPMPTTSTGTSEQAGKGEASTTTSVLPTPSSPPVTSGFMTMEPSDETKRFVTIEPDG